MFLSMNKKSLPTKFHKRVKQYGSISGKLVGKGRRADSTSELKGIKKDNSVG
jgi:hypothetical protein